MKFFYAVLAVTIAVVISSIADIYLKKSHLTNLNYIIIGTILYAIAAPAVAVGFKIVDFSIVFFIWEAVAIVLGISLGVIFFKEELSIMKIAAFSFSIVALIFSYLSSK